MNTKQYFATKKYFVSLILFHFFSIILPVASIAQASQTVSGIITDFNGYWKTNITVNNPVNPNNTHNLLAYTFNGVTYSTSVNDALLTTNAETFIPGIYRALPVANISGTISANTKVALGQLFDGVNNGASNPAPNRSLPPYLTDGPNGLNLGTGVANLPAGELVFDISNIQLAAIGDGIPDVLITQIADPSAGVDQYSFTNSADVVVGSSINISFAGISSLGNWSVDFYEASQNPMTLTAGFTNSLRPFRIWAADFSYFGITAGNYINISKFKILLNGNSDIAFIAYNTASSVILPVTLNYFKSSVSKNDVKLIWQTSTEINADYFMLQHSHDGIRFTDVEKISAKGNSVSITNYLFDHRNLKAGIHFYRLKQVDKDAAFVYSDVIRETVGEPKNTFSFFPNPAKDNILINYALNGTKDAQLFVYQTDGKLVKKLLLKQGTSNINLSLVDLKAGQYVLKLIEIDQSIQTLMLSKE